MTAGDYAPSCYGTPGGRGQPRTATAGGRGGSGGSTPDGNSQSGSSGVLGAGGAGGPAGRVVTPGGSGGGGAGGSDSQSGGGGGGGLYGGGGGGAGDAPSFVASGGGGGGSSLVPAAASVAIDAIGTPSVTITYTAAARTRPGAFNLTSNSSRARLAARLMRLDPGKPVGGNTQVGTAPGQRLVGVPARVNFIMALGPHEVIVGGAGHDELGALGDAAKIYGGAGRDLIHGGPGNDVIYANKRGHTTVFPGSERTRSTTPTATAVTRWCAPPVQSITSPPIAAIGSRAAAAASARPYATSGSRSQAARRAPLARAAPLEATATRTPPNAIPWSHL